VKRLAYALLLLLGFLVVLRIIVVPLAQQRQGRRQQAPTLVARLPAEPREWILRRHFTRPFSELLWPGSEGRFERTLADWGLPLPRLKAQLGLRRLWGGEWLGARFDDGGWFLGGPRSRLGKRDAELALATLPPDTILALEGAWLRLTPRRFLCASSAQRLEGRTWLATLPEWSEIHDLLLAGDWLRYERCGDGGALLAAKRFDGALLFDGLAWGCADGVERLRALAPPPPALAAAPDSALSALPYLRRGGPFAPEGRSLPPLPGAARIARTDTLRAGERAWAQGEHAALSRVLARP
jgi:hypothetical protein